MKAYLAGPMTGYPERNFPEFIRRKKELESLGYEVVFPFDIDGNADNELTRPYVIRLDVFLIIGADASQKPVDAVFVLRGWERSRGTRLEVELACQLDIPVMWADTLELVSTEERVAASAQLDVGLFRYWSPDSL